jgi:uncharacterized membrane protein
MFFTKCGAEIPEGSSFCPKCGAQIAPTPAGPAGPTRRRHSDLGGALVIIGGVVAIIGSLAAIPAMLFLSTAGPGFLGGMMGGFGGMMRWLIPRVMGWLILVGVVVGIVLGVLAIYAGSKIRSGESEKRGYSRSR